MRQRLHHLNGIGDLEPHSKKRFKPSPFPQRVFTARPPGDNSPAPTREAIEHYLRHTFCMGLPAVHTHTFMKGGKVWFEVEHRGV